MTPPAVISCAFCTGQDKIQLEHAGESVPPTLTVEGRHDEECPLGYSAVACVVLSDGPEVKA